MENPDQLVFNLSDAMLKAGYAFLSENTKNISTRDALRLVEASYLNITSILGTITQENGISKESCNFIIDSETNFLKKIVFRNTQEKQDG